MVRNLGWWAALLVLAAAPALADSDDPPARVARLNYQSGTVSFRPGSVEEWTAATLNYPLTEGDHLWTDAGSEAEMHVGSAAIRMNSQTALAILNLDDRTVQLSLTQGSLSVRIRYLAEDETFEVDTPNAAISLLRAGEYRIDADGDSNITTVTVRGGDAEVNGGGAAFPVRARESARITGVDPVSQDVGSALVPDDFDRWCQARDRREEQSESARHVSREMIGYEDLDQYGVWREEPAYGWVWAPARVEFGWAPYRDGRWVWVEPWGWTWVDEAPWGFAPFHYGRWAHVAGGWAWIPGAMVARPVYAPALVVFVGGGGVAWFPLGPGEMYRPAYRVSPAYAQRVNMGHAPNVTNIYVTNVRYVNQNVAGSVTVVPRETFAGARPIAPGAAVMPPGEAARARVVGATAPVAPRRESVLGRWGQPGSVSAPPARMVERPVVVRRAPPPPPVPFRAKQQALEANQGRPLDAATMNGLRNNAPARNPMVRTVPGRPAMAPQDTRPPRPLGVQRNDQRPRVQPPPVRPAPRSVEQPRSERPNREVRREATPERKAPKGERKAEKKIERKEERKEIR
jgi:hypothetical protein